MSPEERNRTKVKSRSAGFVAVVLILGLTLGFSGAYLFSLPSQSTSQSKEQIIASQISRLERELSVSNTELAKTRGSLDALNTNVTESAKERDRLRQQILALNSTLTRNLDRLSSTAKELSKTLEELKQIRNTASTSKIRVETFEQILKELDGDRKLLIEIRKELPDTRQDARRYWESLKTMAARSDPALGIAVERILTRLDDYFNWLDSFPGVGSTREQICDWIFNAPPTASDYSREVQAFQRRLLFNVIARIDSATSLAAAQ